jgi:hypothetical protein
MLTTTLILCVVLCIPATLRRAWRFWKPAPAKPVPSKWEQDEPWPECFEDDL